MLWGAWADAVGFITELTDEQGLQRRTGGEGLHTTIEWKRRVGGQYGVQARLPAGTYSDDTQLRLAVARSISGQGFDVEAFARIELTVWPAYALGGGRASRAAASGMAKANATWHTNYYDGWTQSGGNGAAMRIQPHVWAAGNDDTYIVPVLRDAVVTHGHPRALVGAVLHAVGLAFAFRQRRTAAVSDWRALLHATSRAVQFFSDDTDLHTIWVPSWERQERRSFADAWEEAVQECSKLLESGAAFVAEVREPGVIPAHAYRTMAERMGLTEKKTLGSGTATVTAAMALAAAFENRPLEATLLAAGALGTDTDTIATVAACTIAAAIPSEPPGAIQDEAYLRAEAARLSAIAAHEKSRTFPYPDTLRWKPPQSQLDAVGLRGDRVALAGIGWLEPMTPPTGSRDAAWSWMQSSIGASFLVKHRLDLRELPTGNVPSDRDVWQSRPSDSATAKRAPQQEVLFDDALVHHPVATRPRHDSSRVRVEDVLSELQREGLEDDAAIGRALRVVARSGTRDQLAVLAGTLFTLLREQ